MGGCCTNIKFKATAPEITTHSYNSTAPKQTDFLQVPSAEVEEAILSLSSSLHALVRTSSNSKVLELKLNSNPLLNRRIAAKSLQF